jgi:hypothetical protein
VKGAGDEPGAEGAEASEFRASSRGARPTAAKMPTILPKKDFREWMGVTGRRGLIKVSERSKGAAFPK